LGARRWGAVDVIDLGFGVLTLPAGNAADLLDRIEPTTVGRDSGATA
jgi:hypothetical protein